MSRVVEQGDAPFDGVGIIAPQVNDAQTGVVEAEPANVLMADAQSAAQKRAQRAAVPDHKNRGGRFDPARGGRARKRRLSRVRTKAMGLPDRR